MEVRIGCVDDAAWYTSSVHGAVIALVKEALHRALQVRDRHMMVLLVIACCQDGELGPKCKGISISNTIASLDITFIETSTRSWLAAPNQTSR